ncbi:hypothetical protein [Undibacterium sp.]|uniref:hypothetical protein n=1 Tax=Undibacterium sp. TaxID=1914977 RepID=UPI002CC53107|nr:hypothetical protein [Undibacterium sp.]HTD06237.1 hypothetical protein [Undibacterium sp.]
MNQHYYPHCYLRWNQTRHLNRHSSQRYYLHCCQNWNHRYRHLEHIQAHYSQHLQPNQPGNQWGETPQVYSQC